MANWAYVQYVIEGEKEDLNKIKKALETPENSSWEGNVFLALGITEEKVNNSSLRGFIQDFYFEDDNLCINTEEAWSLTDFSDILSELFPNINIYWYIEEPGCKVFETNDSEGKYFSAKYYVEYYEDDCTVDSYYFSSLEDMLEEISEITEGKVTNLEELDKFNEDDKTYFIINEIEII